MSDVTATTLSLPAVRDSLHEVLREGARKMRAQAIEAEVADWIDRHAHLTDEQGRRQVVRNGISTGDFTEALSALLGLDCPGLSAAGCTRRRTCSTSCPRANSPAPRR